MISRGLLLVSLVLACLQSFTTANNSNEPATCCFGYYESPIPFRVITEYKVTHPHCTKPGVFFTLKKDNRQVCVDPELEWVQKHMKRIDQILYKKLIQSQMSV